MISKSVLACAIAALLCAVTFAQKPTDKPPSKTDRPKPAGAITPRPAAITPRPAPITPRPAAEKPEAITPSATVPKNDPTPAPSEEKGPADPVKPAEESTDNAAKKEPKPPTIITAEKVEFDNKANVAIFINDVVVVDPEFTIHCDKLTAHLLRADASKPDAAAPGKPAGKPGATPAPKSGAGAAAKPDEAPAKKKGSGLEKAIAESTSERRVIINQDKTDAEGKVTHGIGRANKAIYDSVTGDVYLYGSPEVIQGAKSVVAVDPDAVIILNRDGHMSTKGMTKTTIDNDEDR